LILAAAEGVVRFTIVILLEVGLEPLAELEIILVLCLSELPNLDVTLDAVLVEGVLEEFVVIDKFVFVFGVPLDLTDGEGAGVEAVHDGAVDGSGGALFNLAEVELQKVRWVKGLTWSRSLNHSKMMTFPTK
jgi:hypothetical protein